MKSSKRIVFSPFTRVEGDLRLAVEISDGRVVSTRASGTLFRGFEDLVRGREPLDAIVFLCRICGQCGASHSAAAAAALADAYGVETPPNGLIVTSAIQAVEMILSHLAHFYFSFGADLCAARGDERMAAKMTPIKGSSFQKALRARRAILGLMGILAGKWPNTLAIHPGGVTKTLSRSELMRARGILEEFARFVEGDMLAGPIERWLENRTVDDVKVWMGEEAHGESDTGCFVSAALAEGLDKVGRGPGRFLSSGGFSFPGGGRWLRSGYYDGAVTPLDAGAISEDVAHSWYESEQVRARPNELTAIAAPEKKDAYSWCKAPRYAGKSAEVGPMARLVIAGDPLAEDLMRNGGPSVFARVLLRVHEAVRLVKDLGGWLGEIDPEEPFFVKHKPKETAEGFALTEAPRGMLGHWVRIERSRIRNYQVVTPTGWNLSPLDSEGQAGPLEEALLGTPVRDPEKAANVVMVVGSYDPCLYCSVH